MARSAGLPLAESPPISALPKPILIGAAARAVNAPSLASSSATTTAPTRVQVIDRFQDCFMPSSLSARLVWAAGLKLPQGPWDCQGHRGPLLLVYKNVTP